MTLVGRPKQRFCFPKPCSTPATFHLLHKVTQFRFHCNDVPDNFNWIGFPMQDTYGMPNINFALDARFRRSDTRRSQRHDRPSCQRASLLRNVYSSLKSRLEDLIYSRVIDFPAYYTQELKPWFTTESHLPLESSAIHPDA
jgi:hypothetical protein